MSPEGRVGGPQDGDPAGNIARTLRVYTRDEVVQAHDMDGEGPATPDVVAHQRAFEQGKPGPGPSEMDQIFDGGQGDAAA